MKDLKLKLKEPRFIPTKFVLCEKKKCNIWMSKPKKGVRERHIHRMDTYEVETILRRLNQLEENESIIRATTA